jgi:hypothetical protein
MITVAFMRPRAQPGIARCAATEPLAEILRIPEQLGIPPTKGLVDLYQGVIANPTNTKDLCDCRSDKEELIKKTHEALKRMAKRPVLIF